MNVKLIKNESPIKKVYIYKIKSTLYKNIIRTCLFSFFNKRILTKLTFHNSLIIYHHIHKIQ